MLDPFTNYNTLVVPNGWKPVKQSAFDLIGLLLVTNVRSGLSGAKAVDLFN